MNEPVINHDVLGDLVYEDLLKGYVGSIELSEMPLKINLVASAQELNQVADSLIQFLESEQFAEVFIEGLEKLLTIKNSRWLRQDEPEYTLEELCDFVSLDAIVMHADKIELYTDDLELLWRNRAVLKYNFQYQLMDVEIEESAE